MTKHTETHHRINLALKVGDAVSFNPRAILVRGGKRAYLWIGDDDACYGTLSGVSLVALAQQALAEMTPPKGAHRRQAKKPAKRSKAR